MHIRNRFADDFHSDVPEITINSNYWKPVRQFPIIPLATHSYIT
jgi:hypothetical protein